MFLGKREILRVSWYMFLGKKETSKNIVHVILNVFRKERNF